MEEGGTERTDKTKQTAGKKSLLLFTFPFINTEMGQIND